jgi:predicted MPP superfamily phosphohydrolase
MKTITIGDIHGLDSWKVINPDKYDRIILLGDYVDSFSITDEPMMTNVHEIIAFKKAYPDKVILLIGNHEASYLDRMYRGSGFRQSISGEMRQLLRDNETLFQVAFQMGNYLWSHAGINQKFYDLKIKPRISDADENLAATLQRLFHERYYPIFEPGPERGGSSKHIGGPLWLDKSKLISDPLKGYHQVVGHTPVTSLEHYNPYPADPDTSLTFCDCLEYGDGRFLEFEIIF